ncbi:helix-turn-helix domain-containing protein [Erwinia persicina]|nr:helix-turn-helix domain-containing protein [Erwinia persicina]
MLPKTIWFRRKYWPAGTLFPERSLPWGKVMYSVSGVAEIQASSSVYLSTTEYALWLPPQTTHQSVAKTDIHYIIVNIAPPLCLSLPERATALKLNLVTRAILHDFSLREIGHPVSRADRSLVKVFIEQLALCEAFTCYLPMGSGEDGLVALMTAEMNQDGSPLLSLKQWSQRLGLSERALSRRFSQATGIAFNEWKLRKKVILALRLLQEGRSVKYVSAQLDYNYPSAFIAMFRHRMGVTPADFIRPW